MEKKKMLFVYNPRAGKAKIRSNLLDIIDIFARANYEVTAYPTKSQGDGLEAVKTRRWDYYDIVACCGGDGTLDEVVTGMMQCRQRIPIGYVPAGSTNDFAASLGIPRNMIKAAHAIVNGQVYGCDIGSFNDDFFVYIAAFGLFTDVSYETRQDMKNMLGHMAYLLEGMKRLSAIQSYHMHVITDEGETEGDFMYGMVTNSVSVGGFKNITGKNVQLNDGVFEVTLIKRPSNPMELNRIMAAFMDQTMDTDCIYCVRTSHIQIQAEEEIAWTLDGEFGGNHKQVSIINEKQALDIMIPNEKNSIQTENCEI